tara:strand:+ start:3417 stop:3851 length:435 start_codon:yes stop_codon:yes gene_type:complete
MNYAILDGTSIKSTGTIQQLFPNTCFSENGVNTTFLSENNVVDFITYLSYEAPTQKLTQVDPYIKDGKVYNVKVESTTTEEQAALVAAQWDVVRMDRNMKLEDTDWRASNDLTLSNDWKTYRQALRDITTQSDPYNVTWPTIPS